MAPEFVHLRLHSEYSLVDGLVRLKPLVEAVAAMAMPAVALTDFNNFFGLVKFYKAAQNVGVKPILGADVLVVDESGDGAASQLVLLIADNTGYKNLTALISKAYREGQRQGIPTIRYSWLESHSDGLIVLSGGRQGDIGTALVSGRRADADRYLSHLMRLFPKRCYIELQRTGRIDEED